MTAENEPKGNQKSSPNLSPASPPDGGSSLGDQDPRSQKNITSREPGVSQESVQSEEGSEQGRFDGIFSEESPAEGEDSEALSPGYDEKVVLEKNPLIPQERTRLREEDGEVVPPEIILRRAPAARRVIGSEITVREAQGLDYCGAFTSEYRARVKAEERPHLAFSDERKVRYCQLLAKYGLKYKVCKAVGVNQVTVARHAKEDPDFAAAIEEAMEIFKDTIEETIHDRAIHGWKEPVFSQRLGCQIGEIHRFDNRLLELLAKRHIPEYRDKQQVDVSVGGGLLLGVAQPSTAEEWVEENRRIVENQSAQIEKGAEPNGVELAMDEKQVEPSPQKGTAE